MKISSRGALLVLAVLQWVSASAFDGQQPGHARVVQPKRGTPIASRLLPGDTIVDLKWIQEEPLTVAGPTGSIPRAIRSLLNNYDSVVLVDHITLSPFEVPNGGWIRTKVSATIIEVFKPGSIGAKVGTVQFEFDGGELKFGDVMVRTDRFPDLDASAPHLLTLRMAADSKVVELSGFWARPDAEGHVVAMQRSDGTFNQTSLRGKPWSAVIDALRRQAK